MDYGLVSFPPQLPQESPYLPLCDQPVSLGLAHQ
jgi:hypothetical protein